MEARIERLEALVERLEDLELANRDTVEDQGNRIEKLEALVKQQAESITNHAELLINANGFVAQLREDLGDVKEEQGRRFQQFRTDMVDSLRDLSKVVLENGLKLEGVTVRLDDHGHCLEQLRYGYRENMAGITRLIDRVADISRYSEVLGNALDSKQDKPLVEDRP